MLTQSRLKELLRYDPDTGVFTWAVRRHGVRIGDVAGGVDFYGYLCIKIDGRLYKAHRLAWLYVYGKWPADQMDHINGVCDDNRLRNLREATHAQNEQNRALNANNVSGYPGVSWHKRDRKWQSQIGFEGRGKHLGYFDDPESAYAAYLSAKAKLHTFHPTVREKEQ